jgi:RecJ-like exonuclease
MGEKETRFEDLDTFDIELIKPLNKDQYSNFLNILKDAVSKFKEIDKTKKIKLISHLDADGITSAAIMVNALKNENIEYDLTIVPQLTDDRLENFAKEDYDFFIITDLGSSQLENINKHLPDKKILILDHHEIQSKPNPNIIHVNPHLADIDGSNNISGSGTVFLFSCLLNQKNYDVVHIALIGAIGDVQEDNGFSGINNLLLKIAIERDKIYIKNELNFFGKQTRPLFKLLEYSSDLNIPGITGSQNNSILFLNKIGIKPKFDDQIIIKRSEAGFTDHSNVFGNTYELINEDFGTFRDAKEFSTILNACGRMDQAKIGVYACLAEDGYKHDALNVHKDYKREIITAMNWYTKELRNPKHLFKTDKYMILNAKTNVLYTIIGTIASIITKGNDYAKDFYVLSMAHNNLENTIKISLRVVGNDENIDLQKIIAEIIEKLGCGEMGGHQHAAGAVIPIDKEEDFIKIAKEVLDKF